MLVLKDLSIDINGVNIIDNININVDKGSFLTILGPSGSGKTTIIKAIAGLIPVSGGSISLHGKDITNIPPEKRPINTVFQNYAIFPHLNVADNVSFGLKVNSKLSKLEIAKETDLILSKLHLDGFQKRRIHQLSGGQQQRVAIARALINKPEILLLDEPLSALDAELKKDMRYELQQLQINTGITFIMITHDQEEALSLSNKIAVIRDQKIQQIGTPREIYENPTNMIVGKFIGEINTLSVAIIAKEAKGSKFKYDIKIKSLESYVLSSKDFSIGDNVTLALRPEDMRVYSISDAKKHNIDLDNAIKGNVISRVYKGATLDSMIKLEDGSTVYASEFFDEEFEDFDYKINEKVIVSWVEGWGILFENKNNSH